MRPIISLVAAAMAITLAAPVSAASPRTVYLAIGDSLAWGDGASIPTETAYVPLMADYFAGAVHGGAKDAVNVAVRGETTSSYLSGQIGSALAVVGDPTTDVSSVTISLGGNDLLDLLNEPTDECVINPASPTCQALLAGALTTVAANYPVIMYTLASALAADPGQETVYVLTLYNPFGGTGHPFEVPVDFALLGTDLTVDCAAIQTDPAKAGLDDIVACTSMAFGAVVIDGYQVIGDNALALTHIGDPGFNIHPNDDGYALIAKAHRAAASAI